MTSSRNKRGALLTGALLTGALLMGALLMVLHPSPAQSKREIVLLNIDWSKTRPMHGEVVDGGAGKSWRAVRLENPTSKPRRVTLLTIERPPITGGHWALQGQIRHANVEGRAFLEMWNVFANKHRYYSRTLGNKGPSRPMTGTATWRTFSLPFHTAGRPMRPVKLVVNLVLPGRGKVWIGPVKLVALQPPKAGLAGHRVVSSAPTNAWWSSASGGLIGGIGGTMVGLICALVFWFGVRRAHFRFTQVVLATVGLAGLGGLSIGVTALVKSQPYAVYYPPLLLGGLCVVLAATLWVHARRAMAELEQRRMRALDA